MKLASGTEEVGPVHSFKAKKWRRRKEKGKEKKGGLCVKDVVDPEDRGLHSETQVCSNEVVEQERGYQGLESCGGEAASQSYQSMTAIDKNSGPSRSFLKKK